MFSFFSSKKALAFDEMIIMVMGTIVLLLMAFALWTYFGKVRAAPEILESCDGPKVECDCLSPTPGRCPLGSSSIGQYRPHTTACPKSCKLDTFEKNKQKAYAEWLEHINENPKKEDREPWNYLGRCCIVS